MFERGLLTEPRYPLGVAQLAWDGVQANVIATDQNGAVVVPLEALFSVFKKLTVPHDWP